MTREEMITKIHARNAAVTEAEMAKASDGNGILSGQSAKFKNGEEVYWTWCSDLGIGVITGAHFDHEWYYDLFFASINTKVNRLSELDLEKK